MGHTSKEDSAFNGHGWMQFDLREWRDKKADAVGSSDPDVLEPNSK